MHEDVQLDLTDAEWMSVIKRDGEGLPACCGNVSALRDVLLGIARDNGTVSVFIKSELDRTYGWVFGSAEHGEPTPVMRKIAEQAGIDQAYVHAVMERDAEFLERPRESALNAVESAMGTLHRLAQSLTPPG